MKWEGEERRKNQEQLLEEAAKRGARQVLLELGISREDEETIKNMVIFFKGVGVTKHILIWIAGVFTAGMAIFWPIYYLFKKWTG